MKTNETTAQSRMTRIGVHMGNVLLILAERYRKLQKMILEQIQNALDAEAKTISIKIDLQKREFHIWDNGTGVSRKEFDEALSLICKGRKEVGKLGRFGIGVISPIGKCKYFTFTSLAKDDVGRDVFNVWTFNSSEITKAESDVNIPCDEQDNLLYWPDTNLARPIKLRGKNCVPWKTQVKVVGLRMDRRLSRINMNSLKAEIVSNFGKAMQELGAVVKITYIDENGRMARTVDVVAEAYTGEELPVFKNDSTAAGTTFFRLYLADKKNGERSGKVNVSAIGNPFRVPARACLSELIGSGLLEKEVFDDIVSGVFEGDIECEKLTLKVERDGFVDDDTLAGLAEALADWHNQVGLRHVLAVKESKQESVFQKTGMWAMNFIETLFKRPEFEDLLSYLKTGTIGKGHKERKSIGETDETLLSHDGGSLQPRKRRVLSGRSKPHGKGEERKTHSPGTVAGPRGTKRSRVKGHSLGLQFEHERLSADVVYDFDPDSGVLTYNTSHEYWQICEAAGETSLAVYQATVAQIALVLLPYVDSTQYEIQAEILIDFLGLNIHQIVEGKSFFTDKFKKAKV
ncbi:ATP-binding protein [Patescibacteria group bacterium]|nr:ATP-binding protein [Patescibacteria group bacterium]MDE1946942.1 ATP-binding protein [Patescibacteria group bacterium]MDE2011203.1 ATP-binding protein [Patescibacteria group bacterium]MDE2233493.1 ATP-binding protein [Patescibacteria group bacterium]